MNFGNRQIFLVIAMSVWQSSAICASPASESTLQLKNYRHITFKAIPETIYEASETGLRATVANSSSFLFRPLAEVTKVREIGFAWRLVPEFNNNFNVKSADEEQTKKGDDSRLRFGLVLYGKPPAVPFDWLLPSWIKIIKSELKFPSDKMIYLSVGTLTKPENRWSSPHHDSIENLAVTSVLTNGWNSVRHKFEVPLEVVGIWIMSDGDDSQSSFQVEIKDLLLEP